MLRGQFGEIGLEQGDIEFTELNLDYNGSSVRTASAVSIDDIDPSATATGSARVGDIFQNSNAGDVMKSKAIAESEVAANGSGKLGAYFNFVNSVVGAGIIGLPFAVAQSGFWMGLILLFLIAYLTFVGVQTIIKCGTSAGVSSYEGLCKHALGKWGYWTVTWSMIIFPLGGMAAYLIIIGDK
jgi:sodium-coupled neutral amino acid transporter 11